MQRSPSTPSASSNLEEDLTEYLSSIFNYWTDEDKEKCSSAAHGALVYLRCRGVINNG